MMTHAEIRSVDKALEITNLISRRIGRYTKEIIPEGKVMRTEAQLAAASLRLHMANYLNALRCELQRIIRSNYAATCEKEGA